MLRFLQILILGWVVALSTTSAAQDAPTAASDSIGSEVVYWNISGSDSKSVEVFRSSIGQALAGEAGRHLLTESTFQTFVRENAGPVPGCFLGVESCPGAQALVFATLGLSLAIHVKLDTSSGRTRAKYAIIDARGSVSKESSIDASTPRDAAFSIVREVFDATGAAQFETTPVGASVEIDGQPVGATPVLARLPVGKHPYTLHLPNFAVVNGEVEIRSGITEKVKHSFEALSGKLLITDAPAGAHVFVNDKDYGEVAQAIELPPGTYAIEIKADGYESMRDATTIMPGVESRRSAPLSEKVGMFSGFGPEAIAVNGYIFRMGFEHGIQSASFQDARTDSDIPHELRSFTDENGGFPAVGALDQTIHTNGLRLDFSYNFRNIGIVLLSMSYLLGQPDKSVAVTTPLGQDEIGTLVGIQRLQLRPFQVSYREFYGNFVPFAEVGMGMDFTWLDIESEFFNPVTLSQSEGFLGIGAGVQYFMTPNYFATVRYGIQGYFDAGLGIDHLLYLGLGAAFPNVFGFDAEPPEKL
jgi:hypothetical protein